MIAEGLSEGEGAGSDKPRVAIQLLWSWDPQIDVIFLTVKETATFLGSNLGS